MGDITTFEERERCRGGQKQGIKMSQANIRIELGG